MHAAQCSFPFVEGNVALRNLGAQAARSEFFPTECSGKESPLISQLLWFDQENSRQIGLRKNHVSPGSEGKP
jgi:hypothetical protein